MNDIVEQIGAVTDVTEVLQPPTEVVEVLSGATEIVEVEGRQGPPGPKGDPGALSGDIPSDPLAYYILSKS